MLKSELIEKIAAENPHLYPRDVETIVNTILGTITAALARGIVWSCVTLGCLRSRHAVRTPDETRAMVPRSRCPRRWFRRLSRVEACTGGST